MAARCLQEGELSKGDAGAMGQPWPRPRGQGKEELCQAKKSLLLSSLPFFLFQQAACASSVSALLCRSA